MKISCNKYKYYNIHYIEIIKETNNSITVRLKNEVYRIIKKEHIVFYSYGIITVRYQNE
jgi:ASC-1-like (ASCH) protein